MSLKIAYESVKNEEATVKELVSVICGRQKDVCIRSVLELSEMGVNTLKTRGFTENEARKLRAAFNLMSLAELEEEKPQIIRCAKDVVPWLKGIAYEKQEHLGILMLDEQQKVIDMQILSVGNANETIVPTRDILRVALRNGAKSIILFHNHPSFKVSPSNADLHVTEKLIEALHVVGDITLTDHIIVGGDLYLSLREKGYVHF